ncbi:hypothetical protein [Pseudomonas sp. BGI-2]|nr:hypothetical protein [Pseudomonas sp. BGI-2]
MRLLICAGRHYADSRPDMVIALPGGEDTEELVAQARAAGLQTLSVEGRG